jgi:hypothetical protein
MCQVLQPELCTQVCNTRATVHAHLTIPGFNILIIQSGVDPLSLTIIGDERR